MASPTDGVTRAPISDKTGYDTALDCRFATEQGPEWLRPLWIRMRAVRVEEKYAGNTGVTNDCRMIVNYERVFR